MKSVYALALSVACMWFAPSAAPAETRLSSLVEARLSNVQDISQEPNAPRNCTSEGICIDGSFRLTFTIIRNIAGPRISGPIVASQASAMPVANLRYLLVVSRGGNGTAIEWKGLKQNGLCADNSDLARWGLLDAAHHYPCR